jgi:hypothetical protein
LQLQDIFLFFLFFIYLQDIFSCFDKIRNDMYRY